MRGAQLLALLCLSRDAHSLHHPASGASLDLSSSPASPAGGSSSEPALSEAAANLVFAAYMCDSAASEKGGCETLSRHFELSSLLPPPNSKTLLFGSSYMNEVAQAIIAAGLQEEPNTFSSKVLEETGVSTGSEECYCGLTEYNQEKPCACGYQARYSLGDNATIYNVYNTRTVQGGSSSEISNLRALLKDLRAEGFTHALVMEPHPPCWFDDPLHLGTKGGGVLVHLHRVLRCQLGARGAVERADGRPPNRWLGHWRLAQRRAVQTIRAHIGGAVQRGVSGRRPLAKAQLSWRAEADRLAPVPLGGRHIHVGDSTGCVGRRGGHARRWPE
eukprot:scaffold54568_cov59-Phaeocystis_antarctica.AAC.5